MDDLGILFSLIHDTQSSQIYFLLILKFGSVYIVLDRDFSTAEFRQRPSIQAPLFEHVWHHTRSNFNVFWV